MKVHVLEMPEEPRALAAWLEDRVVGGELAELVAELAALGSGTDRPERRLTSEELDRIAALGLDPENPELLRRLLAFPDSLLALSERVGVAPGRPWERAIAAQSRANAPAAARGRTRLETFLAGARPATEAAPRVGSVIPLARATPRLLRQPIIYALAASVAVVAGAGLIFQATRTSESATAWGWNREGPLAAADASEKEYLLTLAQKADEWFDERPENALGVASRLADFRKGCSRLLLTSHPPLSAPKRAWLDEKCRTWAKKLDGHLADLEGGADARRVLGEADETIRKLVTALREQATT